MTRILLIAAALLALLTIPATATANTTTIRPGGHWNIGAVYVQSVHAGGVKLVRSCAATNKICRYIKARPYRDCRVICPIAAAWIAIRGTNGRIIVPRNSPWNVRVRYQPLPHCICE